ncbi:hypothetical protein [Massilia sp. HP4]|uniref:hypothetical protein n=1 Tax=Massilia sp. HP4 TaxID=2562316 RepID=UPI0010C08F7C|nr:hypothetical protein [Massilia sp. HP4]
MLATARFAFNNSLDATVWRGILTEKHDDLQDMVARAAASLPDAPGDPERHANEVLAMCASVMAAMATPGSVDFASDPWFPSFDIDDAGYLAREETVQLLAQRPLMERPMYHLPNALDGYFQRGDRVDLALPHTAVFGVAYMDSTFRVPQTPLVELLSANGAYRLF